MKMCVTALVVMALLCVFTGNAQAQGANKKPVRTSRNPCHPNRSLQSQGQSSCSRYVLPARLCTACKYRPYSKRGFFNNCARIFWLKGKWCRNRLRRYAQLNPCDKLRVQQIKKMDDPDNEMGLDYFIYSICEMCCDCVPMGARLGEFGVRQRKKQLMKVDRANCPAHAVADICKVWPNVRMVYSEREARLRKIPSERKLEAMHEKVCPSMRDWKKKAGPLYKVREIGIKGNMREFMTRFVGAAQCRERRTWNRCAALEWSQFRI